MNLGKLARSTLFVLAAMGVSSRAKADTITQLNITDGAASSDWSLLESPTGASNLGNPTTLIPLTDVLAPNELGSFTDLSTITALSPGSAVFVADGANGSVNSVVALFTLSKGDNDSFNASFSQDGAQSNTDLYGVYTWFQIGTQLVGGELCSGNLASSTPANCNVGLNAAAGPAYIAFVVSGNSPGDGALVDVTAKSNNPSPVPEPGSGLLALTGAALLAAGAARSRVARPSTSKQTIKAASKHEI